ncbi:hypothetical protein [Xenorhabdus ishibashii]|uniref:Uncharacterized protein n=1 Tax=Xenorhabdus ishibashii TaxID=1034471 RepID=A0A2D0K7R4_9GAMM|nr:hypothetical protein [Xenorhabdus ishibashii]PHM59486.1 hypothetical protein Xish_03604 [Xenorhabdus ishibashii]
MKMKKTSLLLATIEVTIVLTGLVVAFLSTFHYLPNFVVDRIDFIPNRFSQIGISTTTDFISFIFEGMLLTSFYVLNFTLINLVFKKLTVITHHIAVFYKIGLKGYKKYNALQNIKNEKLREHKSIKYQREAYKEKRRKVLARKYDNSSLKTKYLLLGLIFGLFIS